ncbi:MAG: DUF1049 domain-containing protein [Gallionella sp.]|jgi:uncharacterized integral membrane protein|nr:DUF1049 domain-containing protein [Gallionella sp.]
MYIGIAQLERCTPVYGRRSGVPMRTRIRLASSTPVSTPTPDSDVAGRDFASQAISSHQREWPIGSTRASRVWVRVLPAMVLLAVIVVFVFQNLQHTKVNFVTASGSVPIAIALLVAAGLGGLLVLAVGSIRIMQLRGAVRRASTPESAVLAAPQTLSARTQDGSQMSPPRTAEDQQ